MARPKKSVETPKKNTSPSDNSSDQEKDEDKPLNLENARDIFALISECKRPEDTRDPITKHINKLIQASGIQDLYTILFIYDDAGEINKYTLDSIYSTLSENKKKKDNTLLILHSTGGLIEPAYLISKCCKVYSTGKFVVAIPRQAKSAATLISLGADEIHMGMISELGPIDPQIDKLPALGLGNGVKYIASLCKGYPAASNMLAKYLNLSLDLKDLGYFERVTESAVQYAELLLKGKVLPEGYDAHSVAKRLVYSYKDHGFVIEKSEAETFLGKDFVKYETKEYILSDKIHKFLSLVALLFRYFKKTNFSIIGDSETGIKYNQIPDS